MMALGKDRGPSDSSHDEASAMASLTNSPPSIHPSASTTPKRRQDKMILKAPLAALVMALVATFATADFNECLGVEMSHLQTIPVCMKLFNACEVGVSKLNNQLHLRTEQHFNPVSVISASESKVNGSDDTLMAMLVQLAPIDECVMAPKEKSTVIKTR